MQYAEENEDVDFVITENEIDAYNDDDDGNLFVELSDEENDAKVEPIDNGNHLRTAKNPTKLIKQTATFNQRSRYSTETDRIRSDIEIRRCRFT